MAIKVKRFKTLEDDNAFHYYLSKAKESYIGVMLTAETLVLHSCLGKTKVVVALNITFETKVYKAVVN